MPLGIWYAATPTTVEQALTTYARLIIEPDDHAAAHPAVSAFVAELTGRPPIATMDEPPSGSIWTWRFHVNQYGVSVTSAWLKGRFGHDVAQQAQRHGLICLDLDEPQLYHPQWMTTSARPIMTTTDGSLVHEPDAAAIRALLGSLTPKNWFAIRERGPDLFLQVGHWKDDNGIWGLEYRDGSAERHYRCELPTLDGVAELFERYARGDTAWTADFTWCRLELES